MNMCNITFKVPMLSTFVFQKSSEKKIFTIIFVVKSIKGYDWNNVDLASQTVVEGISLHVEDILVSLVLSIIISWPVKILAHEGNQYSYVYKI